MAIVLKLPVGRRFKFLLESNKLDDDDKEMYRELISLNKEQSPVTSVKLRFSLKNLSILSPLRSAVNLICSIIYEPFCFIG